MRYFLDTEFIETERTVELVSIAVVAADGREFYAISSEFDPALAGDWVRENVLPLLEPPDSPAWMPRTAILAQLRDLVGTDRPEFWTWGGAPYDFLAMAQLFPLAERLPVGWNYTAFDLQLLTQQGGYTVDPLDPRLPQPPDDAHHALADARWARQLYQALSRTRRNS